jgi:hypothetical protein
MLSLPKKRLSSLFRPTNAVNFTQKARGQQLIISWFLAKLLPKGSPV